MNIAGYPGDSKFKNGHWMAFHSGRILQVDERRIYYDTDTIKGMSGGPVIIYPGGSEQPMVVGIHAYSEMATPILFEIEANSAPRILPRVYDLIAQWIEDDGGVS
ncbi:MAG: hypothetical protein D3909_08125 [Candidatus Electrothrix sp. ATG1]|nr:hypothetical protein [Candidatus Electrothrix sp. ATG1]